MTLLSRLRLAAAFGLALGVVQPSWAANPVLDSPAPMAITPAISLSALNQKLADTIVAQLNSSGTLRGYTVNVSVQGGVVELRGVVSDQPQREEVLRLVQGVPGVDRVLDQLTLASGSTITRVQAPAVPANDRPAQPVPAVQPPGKLPEPLPGQTKPDVPVPPVAAPGQPNGTGPAEPVPLFRAGAPHPYDLGHPRMPPYAWPTYAPYNNYSRVAIPEAYPYNAWPFIGPVHPFPKIPLGWRSVKLEWDDGYWWFSRVATKYDWWRLRYW